MKTLAWIGFAMLALGCSGGGGSTAGDLKEKYSDAICRYYVRCSVAPDDATCRASLESDVAVSLSQLSDAINAGRAKYHADKADACFKVIGGQSCSTQALSGMATQTACENVVEGTIAVGGACLISGECVSQSCLKEKCSEACCMGVCGEKKAKQGEGGPCQSSSDCVAGGFYCSRTGTGPGVCRARVAVGQPCPDTSGCVQGAFCAGTSPTMRTCQSYPKDGESCAMWPVCDNPASFCDSPVRVCKTRSKVGEPCSSANQCVSFATCVNNICVRRPLPGEACAAVDAGAIAGPRCLTGTCTGGVCVARTVPACSGNPDAGR